MNKRYGIFILFLYMIIFVTVFFLAVYSYFNNRILFGLEMPVQFSNIVIMILSLLGVVKSVYHMYTY